MSWDWSQAGQGAAGGAMAGSFAGAPGAIIGGALGGLFGGLAGNPNADYQQQLKDYAAQAAGRKAPQADQSPLVKNRNALIAQLEAMARGEGPSAAAMQMRDSMDRAAGTQASAAAGAGGRGVNAGAAYRNAANNTAAIQSQGARDTAVMRSQEQMNATQMLGQTIGQGVGQDQSLNIANAEAILRQLGLNDEAQLRALLGAMGGSGPGLGTQILAGGGMAMPSALQHLQGQPQTNPNVHMKGSPEFNAWMSSLHELPANGSGPVTQPQMGTNFGGGLTGAVPDRTGQTVRQAAPQAPMPLQYLQAIPRTF